jgi:hypothetical protein
VKSAGPYDRLQTIQQQFRVAASAVSGLLRDLRQDPAALRSEGLLPSDVARCGGRLEETYIVRLFSEFEATIRNACKALWPRMAMGRTPVRTLMDRLAARQSIVFDIHDRTHDVRKYRNSLVHHSPQTVALALHECRSRLAQFLSYLPLSLLG